MFNRILIVCVGNICRSPMAEFLLRDQLACPDICVASAGLGALVGHPPDHHATALLRERGIDASAHRARQLERVMLRDADLVLVMERSHLRAVTRMAPEASGKLFLLRHWVGADDVPDPYRQTRQVFEHACALIEHGVSSWRRYL